MTGMVSLFRRDRWPIWAGGVLGVAILAWLLRDVDVPRLVEIVREADVRPLVLLPLAIAAEQLVRAVKWRLLLAPLCSVRIGRLFSAIMVGYLANVVTPVRVSPLVRAWLVARSAGQKVSTVLATVVVDRLIDGWVYLGFAAAVAGTISFPDDEGMLRAGLRQGVAGVLVGLVGAVAALMALKWAIRRPPRLLGPIARRLPERVARFIGEIARHFGRGVAVPGGAVGYLAVFGASVAMKALSATHFVWAGMAFGIVLAPVDYLFLMVFLGFLATLAGTLRIVGGFTAGAVFALGLFGVGVEQALVMALIVEVASHLTVAAAGAGCLLAEGVSIGELKRLGRRLEEREGKGT